MHDTYLTLLLLPGTYSSEGKLRVEITSGRVSRADVRVVLPAPLRVRKAMSTVAQQ
jgi:hypothetical protein